ncbi:hypothetical protein GCM10023144_22580 [Pigmentiphaga soli]|uniref:Uncharacterized protein n=1 Tax=Pigmentiphaga soli TaxID=1007095 RepID=A0ABP8H042_9BURK
MRVAAAQRGGRHHHQRLLDERLPFAGLAQRELRLDDDRRVQRACADLAAQIHRRARHHEYPLLRIRADDVVLPRLQGLHGIAQFTSRNRREFGRVEKTFDILDAEERRQVDRQRDGGKGIAAAQGNHHARSQRRKMVALRVQQEWRGRGMRAAVAKDVEAGHQKLRHDSSGKPSSSTERL